MSRRVGDQAYSQGRRALRWERSRQLPPRPTAADDTFASTAELAAASPPPHLSRCVRCGRLEARSGALFCPGCLYR